MSKFDTVLLALVSFVTGAVIVLFAQTVLMISAVNF